MMKTTTTATTSKCYLLNIYNRDESTGGILLNFFFFFTAAMLIVVFQRPDDAPFESVSFCYISLDYLFFYIALWCTTIELIFLAPYERFLSFHRLVLAYSREEITYIWSQEQHELAKPSRGPNECLRNTVLLDMHGTWEGMCYITCDSYLIITATWTSKEQFTSSSFCIAYE